MKTDPRPITLDVVGDLTYTLPSSYDGLKVVRVEGGSVTHGGVVLAAGATLATGNVLTFTPAAAGGTTSLIGTLAAQEFSGRYADLDGIPAGSGGGLDAEAVQDIVAAMLGNVGSYSDAAGTYTITLPQPRTNEEIQDLVAALIQAGANVTKTYDDAGNVLTLSASGASSGGSAAPLAGSGTQRPVSPPLGTAYFDTTLGRPIWWDGAGWRDAAGTIILPPATDYRYYRLLITATNGATDRTGVGELVLRETAGGSNLALNQPVTASSDPFGTVAQAVDGSHAVDTGWIANAESLPVWLQVDLGTPRAVRQYTVYGYGYTGVGDTRSPRDWKLQASNDGAAWTTLDTVAGQGGWDALNSPEQSVTRTL